MPDLPRPSQKALHRYWRIKLNVLPFALLVTWHADPEGMGHVKVSVQSTHRPRVLREEGPSYIQGEHKIRIGETRLEPTTTCGTIEDIAWDLHWHPLAAPIVWPTGIVGRHLPVGMRLRSIPLVRFEGTLTYGGETWHGAVLGAFHTAWSRRLPTRWLWIHASACNGGHAAVEVVVARLRVAFLPWPQWEGGYMWLRHGEKERVLVAPRQGTLRVSGLPDQLVVRATPWHGTGHALYGRSHTRVWQKLGNNVINTLVGHVRIPGELECPNIATIEWRNPMVI